jgi:DNA replication protein DnaC
MFFFAGNGGNVPHEQPWFDIKPPDSHNRSATLVNIEERHDKRTTIMAARLPEESWHDVTGGKTIAGTLFHSIVHNVHIIARKGKSFRKKQRLLNPTKEKYGK